MHPLSPFIAAGNFIDKWLIPDQLKSSPILLRKARVLVFLHLFLFIISLAFDLNNTLNFPDAANPPLKLAMLITIGLTLTFRFLGNFTLSGNLLALFLSYVLIDSIPTSGGLYSDNLLWLLAAPLMALLFANPRSGLLWLIGLLGYTNYQYFLEINAAVSFREQTLGLDALYYLITYSGLFIIVVGVVLIFARGQALIIQALNEKQEELERQKQEIQKQAQSLKEAQVKLKSSNRELEQFAYAASHDLKEPLRMIGTYTQLIQRKLNDHLDGATGEYMHFVTDGVTRMDKLLTDLLEYSRLGRTNSQSTNTNLGEILFVVINNLMAVMKDNNAAIYSNPLPVVNAPSTQMIQLFQNLIANSIKFRQEGVEPVIEINYSFEKGNHVFTFHDNGIGIPEEHRKNVFNIFERLHTRQDYEGTGIGLATCKKIVANLGGDIWVEPTGKPGSKFQFTLPSAN
jgi:signal transduction histidine kinase